MITGEKPKSGQSHRYVIVTRRPRALSIRARYASASLASFRMAETGESYGDYQAEEDKLGQAVLQIEAAVADLGPTLRLERDLLPGTPLMPSDVLIAIGQDGLVANLLRYAKSIPILGINPDPESYEGTLLRFTVESALEFLEKGDADPETQKLTLASCTVSTGGTLLAANDVFIGKSNQTSALYRIVHAGEEERQSSSGVIISTPMGSTGWQRSIIAGAMGITNHLGGGKKELKHKGPELDTPRLRFWVREPWESVRSQATLVAGAVTEAKPLTIISEMGEDGVVFADGCVDDTFAFPAGTRAVIKPADVKGQLILP